MSANGSRALVVANEAVTGAELREGLLRRLEEGIGEVLGRAVAVRCVATNIELIPQELAAAGGGDLVSQARKIFADDLADVAEVE